MSRKYLPRTTVSVPEFMSRFPNEELARKHIEEIRWHGNPICPFCGTEKAYNRGDTAPGYYRCRKCRQDFTVRVGTIFHRSHIPLHKWLLAIYLVMTERKGVSSVQLAQELGITQRSAWYMLQRIREALGKNDPSGSGGGFLKDVVEVDEAYLGGKAENRHDGKSNLSKAVIVGLRERHTGRTRGFVVGNTTKPTLQGLVYENVAADSIVCTDDSMGYVGLNESFIHKSVNHSAKGYVDGMAHTNGIESFWAVLKRGFYGVFHWFTKKHTQCYVNEFSFRMDAGSVYRHIYDRMNSALEKMFLGRTTYAAIIA